MYRLKHRGIAQLVEYRSPKPWVAGSNPPAPAITEAKRLRFFSFWCVLFCISLSKAEMTSVFNSFISKNSFSFSVVSVCSNLSVWYSIKKAADLLHLRTFLSFKNYFSFSFFFAKPLDFFVQISYTISAERSATSGVSPPLSERL